MLATDIDINKIIIGQNDAANYATQLTVLIDYAEGRIDHVDITTINSVKSLVDTLYNCIIIKRIDDVELTDEDEGVGC